MSKICRRNVLAAVAFCARDSPGARGRPQAAAIPATIEVDGREAPRRVLRARLTFPAAPGPFALVYPKWLPGEHAPTGPINDLVGIQLTVGGKPIAWTRDAEDMYQIRCELPAGHEDAGGAASNTSPPLGSRGAGSPPVASEQLLVLKWNHVVLYPKGVDPRSYPVTASVLLPARLVLRQRAAARAQDRRRRPLQAGLARDAHRLAPGAPGPTRAPSTSARPGGPAHTLHLFADSPEALAMKDSAQAAFRAAGQRGGQPVCRLALPQATTSCCRCPITSRTAASSTTSRATTACGSARCSTTPSGSRAPGLLPHELVHAWNGKHRRPAGLATADYQQPMKTELLWVYEGLTSYLGEVLAARAGPALGGATPATPWRSPPPPWTRARAAPGARWPTPPSPRRCSRAPPASGAPSAGASTTTPSRSSSGWRPTC